MNRTASMIAILAGSFTLLHVLEPAQAQEEKMLGESCKTEEVMAVVAESSFAAGSASSAYQAMIALLDEENWRSGSYKEVKAAIKSGAGLDTRDKQGRTILHYVAKGNNNPEAIRAFLNADVVEVSPKDKNGDIPLLYAARWNENPAVMYEFLKAGADINARGSYDMAALHWAAWRTTPEVVRCLLDHGAYVNAWSSFGSALELARKHNRNTEVQSVLLEHDAWDGGVE